MTDKQFATTRESERDTSSSHGKCGFRPTLEALAEAVCADIKIRGRLHRLLPIRSLPGGGK